MPVPAILTHYTQRAVQNHLVPWVLDGTWQIALQGYPAVQRNLQNEVRQHGGIRRSFVKSHANGDPVELFLMAMAWGFGTTPVHYPAHRQMLNGHYPRAQIRAIVTTVQNQGAAAGWSALLKQHHVPGLGPSFGTKLLYFAGYGSNCPGPRPLILDMNVRKALNGPHIGLQPPLGMWRADYERYLELAQQWSADPHWSGTPELVEFALFDLGRRGGGGPGVGRPLPPAPKP